MGTGADPWRDATSVRSMRRSSSTGGLARRHGGLGGDEGAMLLRGASGEAACGAAGCVTSPFVGVSVLWLFRAVSLLFCAAVWAESEANRRAPPPGGWARLLLHWPLVLASAYWAFQLGVATVAWVRVRRAARRLVAAKASIGNALRELRLALHSAVSDNVAFGLSVLWELAFTSLTPLSVTFWAHLSWEADPSGGGTRGDLPLASFLVSFVLCALLTAELFLNCLPFLPHHFVFVAVHILGALGLSKLVSRRGGAEGSVAGDAVHRLFSGDAHAGYVATFLLATVCSFAASFGLGCLLTEARNGILQRREAHGCLHHPVSRFTLGVYQSAEVASRHKRRAIKKVAVVESFSAPTARHEPHGAQEHVVTLFPGAP